MWKSITILMGPPGSGKTTIGEQVVSVIDDVFFVSVGGYLRNKLFLKPPFHSVDREAIFEKIVFEEFGTKKKQHLIVDCNPFPPEMWAAVSKQLIHFEKIRLLLIGARHDTLQKRLDSRDRKDHPLFSNKERLEYYSKNIEPAIKGMGSKKMVEYLQNETKDDYKKCVKAIIKMYEKS